MFFFKLKAFGVSFGFRVQGYELNIFENGRNGVHFGVARSSLPFISCQVLQALCGPIVLIRIVSIFSFVCFFSENLRHFKVSLGSRVQDYDLNIGIWAKRRFFRRSA